MADCTQRIEEQCMKLLQQSDIRTTDLIQLLNAIQLTDEEIQELSVVDERKPYGRKVLFNHSRLEVMIATWTRQSPCAPHDHSVSRSAILVLQGRSHHRLLQVREHQLVETLSERKCVGDIIRCAPLQVHAMGDDSAQDRLITLHAYAGGIDNMLVYAEGQTLIVSGDCGAWVPDDPTQVLDQLDQVVTRDQLMMHESFIH